MSFYENNPSGVPAETRKLWLGTVKCLTEEQEEYRRKLHKVIDEGNPWCLVVYGKIGNGKSFFAQVAIATRNDHRFYGAIYTTQPRIQAELWSGDRMNGDVFKELASASALVIDELSDREKDWTDFIKTNIENILVERHSRKLPTVLIGNVTKDRMVKMFDKRIRDRLKEGLEMEMKGSSLRKENNG